MPQIKAGCILRPVIPLFHLIIRTGYYDGNKNVAVNRRIQQETAYVL